MFELTEDEFKNWRSQFVTSNSDKLGLRHSPMAFTEHGIVMLASVLRSEIAINVSVQIIRVFVEMKRIIHQNKDILLRLNEIENHLSEHDDSIFQIMEYLKRFIKENNEPRKRIGFK